MYHFEKSIVFYLKYFLFSFIMLYIRMLYSLAIYSLALTPLYISNTDIYGFAFALLELGLKHGDGPVFLFMIKCSLKMIKISQHRTVIKQ